MQIRPTAPTVRPTPTASQTPLQPAADRFVPGGEVAIPHPKPCFPPTTSIDQIAGELEQQWGERMQGQQRCIVGVVVERGWRPTSQHDEVLNIADAIMDSGGLPQLLYLGKEPLRNQMESIDALALPGGRDIDPSKYGARLGPGMDPTEPDPAFDDFEIAAIRQAYERGLPMLGHCRGAQIMNVAGGGTMTQDIPTEYQTPEGWGSKYGTPINHRPEEVRTSYSKRIHPAHLVVAEEGSRLASLAGPLQSVNSVHHQCIAQISPLLMPVAFALDGLVEGFERKGMPWQAGYQFHPEALRYTDARYQQLYDHLVSDGEKYRQGQLAV